MAESDDAGQTKRPKGLAVLAWILAAFLLISLLVNVVTILAAQSLRRTVNQMHEPVYSYYAQKLDAIQNELSVLSAGVKPEGGKSPYAKDEERLDKRIERARELWERTHSASDGGWLRAYRKAERAQQEVQKAWAEYRKKLGLGNP